MNKKNFIYFCFISLMCFTSFLHAADYKQADSYKRIVSLDICSDWMLQHYADAKQVVALSPLRNNYSQTPEQQQWPTHNGSLEQILELQPDLVLTGEFNAIILRGRLKELGIRVEVFPLPDSMLTVQRYIQRFVNLITSEKSIPVLPELVESNSQAPRLLLLGANGSSTGMGTLEHEILSLAGWQNYITQMGYGRVNLEQLVMDPPDAILWSAPSSPALANLLIKHKALKQAMLNKPNLSVSGDKWQCAGPWTWQQIQQLTRIRKTWPAK